MLTSFTNGVRRIICVQCCQVAIDTTDSESYFMPTVLSDILRFKVAKASDMVQVAIYAIHPCGFHTTESCDHDVVLGFIDSGYHCPATFADENGKNSVRQQ